MSDLRVEPEHAYGGETNYHIIDTDARGDEEVIAVVYARPDIAYGLVNAVNLTRKL